MAQSLSQSGVGNIGVQASGENITVTVIQGREWALTRYEGRRESNRDLSKLETVDLLEAYTESIPVIARDAFADEFCSWLEDEAANISVRVLVGRAGRGKTRFALKLCDQAVERGWDAAFLATPSTDQGGNRQSAANWTWSKPTLLVLDYAASRSEFLKNWIGELALKADQGPSQEGGPSPLRILLVERQANLDLGWMHDVFGGGDGGARAKRRLLDTEEPIELPAITDVDERRAILAAMLKRLGSSDEVPTPGNDLGFDDKLAHVSWGGEPLFLMMAAVLAKESSLSTVLELPRDQIALEIGERELTRIESIVARENISPEFARHLTATVTLYGGLDETAALAVIEQEKTALGFTNEGSAATIFSAFYDALPGPDLEVRVLEPITPDAVGEAVMVAVWKPPFVQRGIETVLRAIEVDHALITAIVIRTCQDFAIHGYEHPLQWLQALGEAASADLSMLLELSDELPQYTLTMRVIAVWVSEELVDRLSELETDQTSEQYQNFLGAALNNLANRLSDVGRREEALKACEEAVEFYRTLVARNPDAFIPKLAMSLGNLANRLSEVGRREEALEAGQEAVEFYRTLVTRNPDAFTPDLAMSLGNLASRLSDVGRREAALEAGQEAVEFHRALVARNPNAFTPNLATNLSNLASQLSDVGRFEEALEAGQEAVEFYRTLVARNPDAFTPNLAMSLSNLASLLSRVGRDEEALEASQEAVEFYRTLVARNPDAFTSRLSITLGALHRVYEGLNQPQDSLAAIREAVETLSPLFLALPDAHWKFMYMMVRDYINACERVEEEPDGVLLGPITDKLKPYLDNGS